VTEKWITRRLVGHFGYAKNVVLPNYANGLVGWEADLVLIRPSGWAEEFEVKISAADFKAEFRDKAGKHRRLVEGHPKNVDKPLGRREHRELNGYSTEDFDRWEEALASDLTEKVRWSNGKITHPEPYMIYDWRSCTRHQCRRFWFAMPHELAEKLLPSIPDHAGLIAVSPSRFGGVCVDVKKEAPVLKMAEKFPQERLVHVLKCAYYRMWQLECGHRKPMDAEVA
jgi:hypothetical protein